MEIKSALLLALASSATGFFVSHDKMTHNRDLPKHAACNDAILLKSTRNVQDAQEGHEKVGARPSHRHQKPCEKPCDRAANPCAVERGYEYVYLTQTVEKVYTSVSTTTVFTSTSVVPSYTATVAAYVVSISNNQVEADDAWF